MRFPVPARTLVASAAAVLASGLLSNPVAASTSGSVVLSGGPLSMQAATVVDSFSRTTSNGWGTADIGGAWTVVTNPANWSTSPSSGSAAVAVNTEEYAYSAAVARDVDVTAKLTDQLGGCAGGSCASLVYLLVRYQTGSGAYYRIGMGQDSTGDTFLRGELSAGGSLWSDYDTGVPVAANAAFRIHVQVQGTSPTTIRARLWQDGTAEPGTWQETVVDSTAGLQQAGHLGARVRSEPLAPAFTGQYTQLVADDLSPTITFSTTLTGADQVVTAPYTLDINDPTGAQAGWSVTATSTTFTAGSATLPTSATTVTSSPTLRCDPGNGCTLATNSVGYPYSLPAGSTAPTATKLVNAAINSGMGAETAAFQFSLAVPASTYAGNYTSTWTLTLGSGP